MYNERPRVIVVSPNDERKNRIGNLLASRRSALRAEIHYPRTQELSGVLEPNHRFSLWGSHNEFPRGRASGVSRGTSPVG